MRWFFRRKPQKPRGPVTAEEVAEMVRQAEETCRAEMEQGRITVNFFGRMRVNHLGYVGHKEGQAALQWLRALSEERDRQRPDLAAERRARLLEQCLPQADERPRKPRM